MPSYDFPATATEMLRWSPGRKLLTLQRRVRNPVGILEVIGKYLVGQARGAFKKQRRGRFAWAARKVPNTPGILRDMEEGAGNVPAKRFKGRPALVDTGELRRSLTWIVRGQAWRAVEVYTPLWRRYGRVQQEGGTVTWPKLTDTVRENLNAWFKRGQGKKWKPKLGWLLNEKFKNLALTSKVPARPYIGFTASDRLELQKRIRKYFQGRPFLPAEG